MDISRTIVAALLTLVAPPSLAQEQKRPETAAAPIPAFSEQTVDAFIEAAIREQQIVGISVAVAKEGKIVLERHYGFEHRENKVPAGPQTMYRWASISKPVTAVAAMQLVEAGKLDLEADVRTIVPAFPEKPWGITVRQLLCHQGGIVHYSNGTVTALPVPASPPNPYQDVVLALDTFKMSPLVCEPGTKYSYTTHGYMLAGAAVQLAGGDTFWKQVRTRIAEPAGMTSFRPDYQWEQIPNRTRGYRKIAGVVVPSTDTDVSWKLAGGGFISTVGDLSRFSIALMDNTLLKAESFAAMRKRQTLRDGTRTDYGLGLRIGRLGRTATCLHSGSQEKTSTFLLMAPASKASVAIMCNTEDTELGGLARDILGSALGEAASTRQTP
jgi:CubicO group peptidase (beta-lactamase class C family)